MRTGFKELDKQINLDEPKLIILGGRPGTGKSTLTLNIASNISNNQNKSVAIFNLESSKELILNKYKELNNANIFINDEAGIEVHKLCDIVRNLKRERDLKILIIDYLSLMNFDYNVKALNAHEKNDECIKCLKELSNELNITIILTCQLSRNCENRIDKKPNLSDLGITINTKDLEKDILKYIDIVLFLYKESSNVIKVIIEKNANE